MRRIGRLARSSLVMGLVLGGGPASGCRSEPAGPPLTLRRETVRRLDAPLDAGIDAAARAGVGAPVSEPTNIAPREPPLPPVPPPPPTTHS